MIVSGTPQYFTTCFTKNLAACSAVQSVGAAMKVPYLENRSTTTMIDPSPSTLGRAEMKSIDMLAHGLSGTGSVSHITLTLNQRSHLHRS